jgi:hypothetical protein
VTNPVSLSSFYSFSLWPYVIFLHILYDRSNWSSPSISSTIFQSLPAISDLPIVAPNKYSMTGQRDTDWTARKLWLGYGQERLLLLSTASCLDAVSRQLLIHYFSGSKASWPWNRWVTSISWWGWGEHWFRSIRRTLMCEDSGLLRCYF